MDDDEGRSYKAYVLKVKGQLKKALSEIEMNEKDYKDSLSGGDYKEVMDYEIYKSIASLLRVYVAQIDDGNLSKLMLSILSRDQLLRLIKDFKMKIGSEDGEEEEKMVDPQHQPQSETKYEIMIQATRVLEEEKGNMEDNKCLNQTST